MKKIGIIFKPEDRLIVGTAKKIAKELSSDFKVTLNSDQMKSADLIITLGGDGTILRAARITCRNRIPMLTVHLGGLGLLTEISLGELSDAIRKIKKKEYIIDSRTMIKVEVLRRNKVRKELLALNDAVICKSEIARTIKLQARIGDLILADYVADGLIASTSTGSTAYNFAVMGPIMPPEARSYILSPICPHRANTRSIVLEDEVVIKITKGDEVLLTVDGQETLPLTPEDSIKIGIAKERTDFLRFRKYDLWDLLRKKMGLNG